MINTIIFDAEGVVIDTEKIWDNALMEFLKRRELEYERNKIKHLVTGKSIYESVKALKKEFNIKGSIEKLARERINIIKKKLLEDVKYMNGFLNFFNEIDPLFKTCIATSLDRSLLDKVNDKIKLSNYFSNRIYSVTDIGNISKPDPAIFLYAAKNINSNPESCLVIEDSPSGVNGAKNAGMLCIGLTTTHEKEKLYNADFIFNSFQEIELKLIQQL